MDERSFLDRHYFLIRRLHSLSGIAPVGVFLIPHLTTNSSIVWGKVLNTSHLDPNTLDSAGAVAHAGVETFQHEVNFIHDLPALILIEWGVLFLPILFHALVGIWFATSARPNVQRYAYQDNWRYTLQRVSGYVGVVFIFMHLASLRFGFDFWGLMPSFDATTASSTTAMHFQDGAWGLAVSLFYAICVLLLVFHFANGLWTAAITWGLTVSESAQARWGWVCAVVGVGLAIAGLTAIYGFSTLDVENAKHIEGLIAHAAP